MNFDIQKALQGNHVTTKEGELVTGIKLRSHPLYPVCGTITRLYVPDEAYWTIEGKAWINISNYHLDLVMS